MKIEERITEALTWVGIVGGTLYILALVLGRIPWGR